MSEFRLTERVLRHDRLIMAAALGLAVVASAAFILAGGGTGMSVFGMAARTGPDARQQASRARIMTIGDLFSLIGVVRSFPLRIETVGSRCPI